MPAIFEETTAVAEAEAASHGNAMPEAAPMAMMHFKRGHFCCGCCCDVRRATIIVNIIMLCRVSFQLFGTISLDVSLHKSAEETDDDFFKNVINGTIDSIPFGAMIAIEIILLVCHGCGLYGAIKFNRNLVLLSLVAYGVHSIAAFAHYDLASLLICILFAYPHLFLYQEITSGIMSPVNYPNEKQSCCCV